jgi:hypothetical protein
MEAMARKMPQILLESIAMKDTFGIFRRWVPFEKVFDVVHWNSYYPALPRLVRFDPDIHPQWPVPSELRNKTGNHTMPYAFPGGTLYLFNCYKKYVRNLVASNNTEKHPAELLMMKGALRPNPDLQKDIDRIIGARVTKQGESSLDYMTVRACAPSKERLPIFMLREFRHTSHPFLPLVHSYTLVLNLTCSSTVCALEPRLRT